MPPVLARRVLALVNIGREMFEMQMQKSLKDHRYS